MGVTHMSSAKRSELWVNPLVISGLVVLPELTSHQVSEDPRDWDRWRDIYWKNKNSSNQQMCS
jgi:hypothetical protein